MEQPPQEPQQDIRIVRFGAGDELSRKEAESGQYVFAVGPQVETVYAFPTEEAASQVETWAAEQGVAAQLERARKVIEELPDDPGADVDVDAERVTVEEVNRRLQALSDESGLAIGTRGLLEAAHRRRIFDSAILFSQPLYRAPLSLGLSSSCTDLGRYNFANGARSCQTIGYQAVYLYEQPNYGPDRFQPAVRLLGTDSISLTPVSIRSVLFI